MVKKTGFSLLVVSLCLPFLSPKYSSASSLKREFRAVWIATVANIDWPSQKGLPIEEQKTEFRKLLDDVKEMGMNAVIVQIKPTADAFYPSKYGPWSEYLTGVQGKDPGYDPLAFMLKEAHERNLEFHAWFNPYRITMNHRDLDKLADDHPAKKYPEWVVGYGNQLYFDPGIPDARSFIVDGIMEVVNTYDIDGVHLDDYFYPYKIEGEAFPDDESYEKYGADFDNQDDWRRNNVNLLVKNIHERIKDKKRYVKFGISPFGVWRNIADDPTGSDTKAGVRNYDDLYADTRHWIQNGSLDYINPQIYWNIGFEPAAFDILLPWWQQEIANKPMHLYIGQAAYKIDNNPVPEWSDPEEYPRQIQMIREEKNVHGSVHFSLKDLNRNPLQIKDRLKNDLYKHPALIPTMPWLGNKAPKKPKLVKAQTTHNGITLTIQDKETTTAYFAIYRFDTKHKGNIQDPTNLLTTVRKTDGLQIFTDETADPHQTYTYVITSLDRLHNESKESNKMTVKQ